MSSLAMNSLYNEKGNGRSRYGQEGKHSRRVLQGQLFFKGKI